MSAITVSPELLAEAKNYLDITWDDNAADNKLAGQLRRGMAYLKAKTGIEPEEYSGDNVNLRAQALLFSFLLYDREGAVDEFERNYRSDIIGLHRLWEASNAAQSED